jgi:hypothetical protein
MKLRAPSFLALAVVVTLAGAAARAQEPDVSPTPAPTPTPEVSPPPAPPAEVSPAPPTAPPAVQTAPLSGVTAPVAPAASPTAAAVPTPTPAPPARITDPAVVAILQAPAENPFGAVVQVPATLPAKLSFADAVVAATEYVSARVDAAGKPMGVRQERDPIPSLAAEAQKSLARWSFDPARRGTENVETWAALRLELQVEIDAPRSVQGTLVPITPSMAIPRPLAWPSDEVWLESRKAAAPLDGGVPLESVDTPPMPRKTPWTADSYKGPFAAKFWVRVNSNGVVEKAIPLEASEPILVGYLRRAMSAWTFRPAQANGTPIDSWNELSLSGQVSYSVELERIASLRKSLAGS